ncbi:MAG TPA: ATP-binding protein [Candidatus Binatia bacterium]|nr:ATP-binding protein [Candidatus Binatia bacterium]
MSWQASAIGRESAYAIRIGIAPELLPHIFDRFRQAPAQHGGRSGGLGLGLAIARHLVELHGGIISAANAVSGGGALFEILLPLMPLLPDMHGSPGGDT